MDKEGLKKQTDKTVKAGYWRDVSEIPYIELYRVILSMEEMRYVPGGMESTPEGFASMARWMRAVSSGSPSRTG